MTGSTRQRILEAALALLVEQGIRKTSMDDVADRAGVTRVTIYRYFQDKQELVRAVFLEIVDGIEAVNVRFANDRPWDVGACLDALGEHFGTLPKGDLLLRQDELERVYPEVSAEFRQRHRAAVHSMFILMLEVAEGQGLVRGGLHRRVVEAYFQAAVINVMEHPALVSLDLSPAEVYSTASSIFMHGILRDPCSEDPATWHAARKPVVDDVGS